MAVKYKDYRKIVIIWDNLNIHHNGPSKRWTQFNEKHGNKFEFHYTPIHASWINQIEIFFSILHKRCLKHGNFISKADLKEKVLAFIQRWKVNRARLTQIKQQFYALGMANHRGAWEPTPFTGSLTELTTMLTEQFAFALIEF